MLLRNCKISLNHSIHNMYLVISSSVIFAYLYLCLQAQIKVTLYGSDYATEASVLRLVNIVIRH